MKKVTKLDDSKILTESINYIVNGNNSILSNYLFEEQKGFCVYTETYLGRTDKKEIDHFNPTIKGKPIDNYQNWFLIKAQWNSEKSSKWAKYQPVLHPTATDFEDRILYSGGDYLVSNQNDKEAQNLVLLIKLDDPDLAIERKRYISRKRTEIKDSGFSAIDYFELLIEDDLNSIRFIRAIQQEFEVDIFALLNTKKPKQI
jgi:hypothetical protein